MSQTYPIGRDNLNQLMQLQLGTEAFDIIHKVADNLDLIKKVIEVLNNELYSIHISYPLSMVKTPAGIEAEFILVFNQQNEVTTTKEPTK